MLLSVLIDERPVFEIGGGVLKLGHFDLFAARMPAEAPMPFWWGAEIRPSNDGGRRYYRREHTVQWRWWECNFGWRLGPAPQDSDEESASR